MKKIFLLLLSLLSITTWGQERKQYFIGDIYDSEGVRGIVVQVKENGYHGLIMSLDEIEEYWYCNPSNPYWRMVTSASDCNNGMHNQEIISEIINLYNLSWDLFPAFKWCKDKGEGWYLPAINELVEINKAYHGGEIKKNKAAQIAFNRILEENGGKPLQNSFTNYLSSTEITGEKVYTIYFESGMFAYGKEERKGKMAIRAVRKF